MCSAVGCSILLQKILYFVILLVESEVSYKMEHTTRHGAIEEKMQTGLGELYNLDAIISVGYRVNSVNATVFRRWVTNIVRDFLLKGYAGAYCEH